METFGQVCIRLSEHRHLCHLSRAKAESPRPFLSSLAATAAQNTARDEGGRAARQFCKVKHLREQHVRGRGASSYTGDVGDLGRALRGRTRGHVASISLSLSRFARCRRLLRSRERFGRERQRRRHTLLPRLRWQLFIAREIPLVLCIPAGCIVARHVPTGTVRYRTRCVSVAGDTWGCRSATLQRDDEQLRS